MSTDHADHADPADHADADAAHAGHARHATSFDERAATWDDDPAQVARSVAVAEQIAAAVPLDTTMRLLEYGAGTGLVTQALRDRVGPVVLADASRGMRDVMLAKVGAGVLRDAEVRALDLATEPAPDEHFDVIVTVMVLHHITELDVVLARFAELLAPGGRLCVVDLEAEDGSFHGDGFVGHHGFERGPFTAALEAAGFRDVRFEACHRIERDGAGFPLFLAVCTAA